MSIESLEAYRIEVAEALERLRMRLAPEVRNIYKLTFIARVPESPELDIVVTEDEGPDLKELVERRIP